MSKRNANELDAFIGAFEKEYNISACPALIWCSRKDDKLFWYDRRSLLSLDEEQSNTLFLKNWVLGQIQHRIDVSSEAEILMKELRSVRGARKITHVEALELLRPIVEVWASYQWRNGANDYYAKKLPEPFCGWRAEIDNIILEKARTITNKKIARESYWSRAAFVMSGVVAGILGKEHLPTDMRWSEKGLAAIRELMYLETIEDLFLNIRPAIKTLYKRRVTLKDSRYQVVQLTDGMFLGNGNDLAIKIDEEIAPLPSWNAIRKNIQHLVQPLREIVRRRMEENQANDRIRGMRHGRFDQRRIIKASLGDDHVFSLRKRYSNLSYGVELLVDVSPSMSQPNNNIGARPKVFGGILETAHLQGVKNDYTRHQLIGDMNGQEAFALRMIREDPGIAQGAGWHVAFGITVALSEAFLGIEGIALGIAAFSDRNQPVKPITAGFRENEKIALMRAFSEAGNNTLIAESLEAARDSLRKSGCEHKLIIILTDGIIGTTGKETPQMSFEKTIKEGIDIIVLGIGTEAGKRNTPAGRFFLVNDEKATEKAIGAALDRLLKQRVA